MPSPGDHLAGILGRPADLRSLAHLGAQFAGEIEVGIVARLCDEGLECRGAEMPQGRVALALQFFVEPLANDGPIAQVIGDGPDQLDALRAEIGNLFGGGGQEVFGGLANVAGQYDQELSATARAKQDARQAQFRQQRTGQDFAKQSDPLRFAGQ